jgi:hypothetical protein
MWQQDPAGDPSWPTYQSRHSKRVGAGLRGDAGLSVTMVGMWLADRILVHQVHRANINADVTGSMVSNALLWRGYRKPSSQCASLFPWRGSAAVLSMADLDPLAKLGARSTCLNTCRRRLRPYGWRARF